MAAVGSEATAGAASAAVGESLVALHAQPLDAPEVLALAASAPRKKRGRPPRVRDDADAAGAAPPPKRKYTKRAPAPVVAPTKRFVRKFTFIKRKPAAPAPAPRKRGKLFPRFPPEVVGAGTRWRMPPQEQLLKRLPKPVAEYLSITRTEEYEAYCAARLAEMRRRREVGERERRIARWLNNGTELPAYMLREPPPPLPLAEVERPDPAIAEKVEKPLVRVYKSECKCGACLRVRYERVQPHAEYVCRMERCRLKFRDLVAFVDHQVDAHATVNVHCKRSRLEFFRAQVDPVFPPETVYIASQYANATTPPEPWTLDRVEHEKETLEERLATLRYDETFRPVPKRFVRQSFEVAFERVQLYGLAELREQHRIALEHYEAALVFPVGPRNRQDVISSVRLGRNWLRSPEPENSDLARVLKIPARSKDEEGEDEEEEYDEEEEEEEVVLFQFGGEDAVETQSKNKKNDAIVVDTPEIGMDKADKQPAGTELVKVHESHQGTDAPEMICV